MLVTLLVIVFIGTGFRLRGKFGFGGGEIRQQRDPDRVMVRVGLDYTFRDAKEKGGRHDPCSVVVPEESARNERTHHAHEPTIDP
jgi:hypothetical protein